MNKMSRNHPMISRAILTFPRFEGLHLIEQLRRQFDPLALAIAPHITLMFPFESDVSVRRLQAHVRQAVRDVGPFAVQLHGITGSEGEYLFLNVKRGNDRLIELHDRLYSGLFAVHLSLAHTFVPHLTVGRLSNRAAFLAALEAAQEVNSTFRTAVREVAVCRLYDSHGVEFRVRL